MMEFVDSVKKFIAENPLLTTMLSLSGAGIVTFWLKDFPRYIFQMLRRELTTELVITSAHTAYFNMMRWISRNYKNTRFRRLKLSNGQWGWGEETITSIGYGTHWIRYKRNLLYIALAKESANQTDRDKDTLTIVKLGRGRKLFDQLIAEIQRSEKDISKTNIYKMEDCWCHVRNQTKRSLDSVFIESAKRKQIVSLLEKFTTSEEWYISNGIPYQLGILLYGPPGTGKTSLIKALAGYLDYPIYYLSAADLDKMGKAMSILPDKCVVVIEDIDSSMLTHARAQKTPETETDRLAKTYSAASFSEVLNSIDGMFSAHGRLLIATTNHIESLDQALIRPGRIDLKVEIGYVNLEVFQLFMKRFYPEIELDLQSLTLKSELTVATLQNYVMQGKTAAEIISLVRN